MSKGQQTRFITEVEILKNLVFFWLLKSQKKLKKNELN